MDWHAPWNGVCGILKDRGKKKKIADRSKVGRTESENEEGAPLR